MQSNLKRESREEDELHTHEDMFVFHGKDICVYCGEPMHPIEYGQTSLYRYCDSSDTYFCIQGYDKMNSAWSKELHLN